MKVDALEFFCELCSKIFGVSGCPERVKRNVDIIRPIYNQQEI